MSRESDDPQDGEVAAQYKNQPEQYAATARHQPRPGPAEWRGRYWTETYANGTANAEDKNITMLCEMGFAAMFGVSYTEDDVEFTEELGMSQILFELVVALAGTEIKDMRTYSVRSLTT